MEKTLEESIFSQAIATTSLMTALSNNNFLESDYYKKRINFGANDYKIRNLLGKSGIGNPATLQMFLYALLVVPKELLHSPNNDEYFSKWRDDINQFISDLKCEKETTYKSDESAINFFNHIRNSVAHSKCSYNTINEICYITFEDKRGENEICKITMTTAQVGLVLMRLDFLMKEYLNEQLDNKSENGSICD